MSITTMQTEGTISTQEIFTTTTTTTAAAASSSTSSHQSTLHQTETTKITSTIISRIRVTTPTHPFFIHTPPNKRPTVYIYPTVSPESIVVPIVSCILGLPLLALLIICCLRRRAKMARDRARRRNYELEHGTLSLVGLSPIHPSGRSQAISLRSERAMSRGFPSLELDTVVEERSDAEPEGTSIELMTPERESDGIINGKPGRKS